MKFTLTNQLTKNNLKRLCLFLSVVLLFSTKGNAKNLERNSFFQDPQIVPIEINLPVYPHTFQLFSHGRPGELLIDGSWKNAQEIANFLTNNYQLSTINQLNIYGCEFAKGTIGLQAVAYLQKTLGVSVSASTNITGKDGDWVLEVGKAKDVIAVNNYTGNLAWTLTDTCATCDFDGDGIPNNVDLDDDNDGVLDVNEMQKACDLPINWTVKAYGGYNGFSSGSLTNYSIPSVSPIGAPIGTGTISGNNINAGSSHGSTTLNSYLTETGVTYTGSGDADRWAVEYDYIIPSTGLYTVTMAGGVADAFQISKNSTQLYGDSYAGGTSGSPVTNVMFNKGDTLKLFNAEGSTCCTWFNASLSVPCNLIDIDTDGDGIPNRFDLDSDNDGCPDAVEASVMSASGATFSASNTGSAGIPSGVEANAIAPSAYGANGFSNVLETATESGIYKYNYTYRMAIDSTKNACTDSDGDGVPDVFDLDDDNDGILNAVESPSCFYTAAKAAVFKETGSDLAWDAGYPVSNATNGDNTDFTQLNPNAQSIAGKSIITLSDSLNLFVPITSVNVQMGAFGYAAGATAKLQGWDGMTWVDLSASTNLNVTSATQTFTNTLQPNGYFSKVRIEGITGTTNYDRMNEITVTLNNYKPSLNPTPTCNSDTDGDGIPNYLDLDSDGDGCPDAIEGGAGLAASTLVTSTMPGGNSGGTYTGTSSSPVVKNLCNAAGCVGSTPTTMGVPTVVATGQAIGNSQNKLVQSANCPVCLAGTVAPAVTPTTASATCPSTVNLTTLASTGSTPVGATKIWSTHKPPTTVSDTLTTAQASAVAVSGKYYTFFYDKVGACYSPADSVIVTITPCPATPDYVVTPKPACLTCSVKACVVGNDIPAGAGTPTITTCGTPAGYTAAGPDASGCFTYTPTASVSLTTPATSCIVICKNGVCDTTYITIPVPVTPDTIVTPPAKCPTCALGPVCAVGDDIPAGTGTPTYTSCGAPAGYSQAGPDANGCFTYTPTSATSVSLTTPATSCIVVCKNGVCDTSYITIPVPVSPDTVLTPPAKCPTCAVGPVCAVGDDIPAGAGTPTYTSCGAPAGYSQSGPDANGCFTYTPTSATSVSLTTPATSCIVVCKNGVCDTSYITIPVPVTPDTVVTPPAKCPTCAVGPVCAVGDDIPAGAGTPTYTSCGAPAGYSQAGPDANGCFTYTPTSATSVSLTTPATSCIVVCKNGVCDTSYITIPVPVTPDTVVTSPAKCPTCAVGPVCAIGDDIPAGAGTPTYTSCGAPAGYSQAGPDANGCFTYTPTSATSVSLTTPATSCIVVCKNGVCDTSYITIPVPVTPDTVVTPPAKCPTCAVGPVCAVGDDIPAGAGTPTYTSCGAPAGYSQAGPDANGCYTYTPTSATSVSLTTPATSCIVVCKNGVCDTSYITIPVPVTSDTVVTPPAKCPTCAVGPVCAVGDDIPAGTGTPTYTSCGAPAGYSQSGPDANGCFTYTPTSATSVSLTTPATSCIVVCKNGVCDTTYITIPVPVTPDTAVGKPTCPTCPVKICVVGDDIPAGAGTPTYTSCGLTSPFGSFVMDLNGCLIWQGNGTQTITDTIKTCVVVCNNGVCDTTYIKVLPAIPPYGPDTIKVTPTCSTCPLAPICATGDDIPVGYTNKQYHSCGLTFAQSALGTFTLNASGCAVWTPNGNLQTDTIKTCVIVCADTVISGTTYNVCDTTAIWIAPPPTPDYDTVTPACPTCPIKVCPIADDITITSATTFSTCGAPTGYTLTSGPSTAGCYTFTPDPANPPTGPVTTCVVACNGTVCDTTYVVINKPVSPDTVTVKPACPTCPVTVCVVGDDIPVGSGTASYSSCGTPAGYNASPIDANGCVTYTPMTGTSAPTTTVTSCIVICNNGVCDTTYVIINPPAPIENSDVDVTNVNTPVSGNVNTNDVVPAGTTYGTPTASGSNPSLALPTMNSDGTYTFTAGTPGVYVFDVPVCTPGQATPCPTVPLIITVNDPSKTTNLPVANTDLGTTKGTNPVTINSLANDLSANTGTGSGLNPSTVVISTPPLHGSTSVNPTTGAITYTPTAGFVGNDTLYYSVTDSAGHTSIAMQVITVLPSNAGNTTTATDDYASGPAGTNVKGNVLNNDIDPEGNTTSVLPIDTIIPGKGHLIMDASGNYTFTPVAGFTGPVSLPYSMTDGNGATAKATLHILIGSPISNLAVNWTAFGLQNNNCIVSLSWKVADVKAVTRFEIERSNESMYWSKIGEITNIDHSQVGQEYSFTDPVKLQTQTVYYRIKDIEFNGAYSYTGIKTASCPTSDYSVGIYPNPAETSFTLNFNRESALAPKVIVYNMAGQRVQVETLSNNNNQVITYSIANLANGVYTVSIDDNQYGKTTIKLLKK